MPVLIWAFLLWVAVLPVSQSTGDTVAAWIDHGDLWLWETDSPARRAADGNIKNMWFSPSGEQIAYIRTEVDRDRLYRLVLSGDGAREIVLGSCTDSPAGTRIAQVGWQDENILWFSTATEQEMGEIPAYDLWRSAAGDPAECSLAAGAGGVFSFSPDRQRLVLTSPGSYEQTEAEIRLLDTVSGEVRSLLSYPAVSTASEYAFHPVIDWDAAGTHFFTALPAPDLIYFEGERETSLWRISVEDGSAEQVGSVNASFFGQPSWSFDGEWLAYLERRKDDANRFDLLIAEANGANPRVVATGSAGEISTPEWIPGMAAVAFTQSLPGTVRLAQVDGSITTLGEDVIIPQFVPGGMIYAALTRGEFEIRWRGEDGSVMVVRAAGNFPGALTAVTR